MCVFAWAKEGECACEIIHLKLVCLHPQTLAWAQAVMDAHAERKSVLEVRARGTPQGHTAVVSIVVVTTGRGKEGVWQGWGMAEEALPVLYPCISL